MLLKEDLSAREVERVGKGSGTTAIVIVTYNSAATICACLRSVLGTTSFRDEILVIDNASRDDTVSLVQDFARLHARVRLFPLRENKGFSEGCNIGIRDSESEFVLLLNPDTEVYGSWLNVLKAAMREPRCAAVGPLTDAAAAQQVLPFYAPDLAVPLLNEERAYLIFEQFGTETVEMKLLIGFCLFLRRAALEEVGILDNALFLGNDDLDICWRLRLAGWRCSLALGAYVHHDFHISFKSEPLSLTERLVRESTDVLACKLLAHYGEEKVPLPEEIWDVDWFLPAPELARRMWGERCARRSRIDVSVVIVGDRSARELAETLSHVVEVAGDTGYEVIVYGRSDSATQALLDTLEGDVSVFYSGVPDAPSGCFAEGHPLVEACMADGKKRALGWHVVGLTCGGRLRPEDFQTTLSSSPPSSQLPSDVSPEKHLC